MYHSMHRKTSFIGSYNFIYLLPNLCKYRFDPDNGCNTNTSERFIELGSRKLCDMYKSRKLYDILQHVFR